MLHLKLSFNSIKYSTNFENVIFETMKSTRTWCNAIK